MIDLYNLIASLPLIAACYITVSKAFKAYKTTPFGPDEKEIAGECLRSVVYIFAAGILMWLLMPWLGAVGCFFGTTITIAFAVLTILCVVDLPSPHLDRFSHLIWTEWRKTPVYSKTGQPVEYIRWGRRFGLVLFLFSMLIMTGVGALLGGSPAQASAAAQGSSTVTQSSSSPAAASPSAPATSAAPSPTSSTPADTPTTTQSPSVSASAQVPGGSSCPNIPSPFPTISPEIDHFATGNMEICYNGKWLLWSDITMASPPTSVTVTAAEVVNSYKYAIVTDPNTGDTYVIRTTKF